MKLSDIGVTPIKEKQFATKGIFTVEDLVAYLPNRYNDYSQITGILPPESVSCFRATVDRIERKYGGKKPYLSGKVTTQDWSGYRSVFISWFNMNFLYNEFCSYIGQEVLIVGKVQERNGYLVMTNPEKFGADFDLGIYPVYPQINKMNAKYLSDTIRSSITVVENHCEMLPSDVVKKYNLLPMSRALHFIHEPKDMGETVIGKQRSIINDLIYFSVHNTLNHADSFIKSKYAVTSLKLMNWTEVASRYKQMFDNEFDYKPSGIMSWNWILKNEVRKMTGKEDVTDEEFLALVSPAVREKCQMRIGK